jgi:hypothetical protein
MRRRRRGGGHTVQRAALYTRVILKHPPHVLQLARSQQLLVGTPHILLLSKQLLVGAPHTNSGGMKKSREGWFPPSERTNGRLTYYRPIAKCMPNACFRR